MALITLTTRTASRVWINLATRASPVIGGPWLPIMATRLSKPDPAPGLYVSTTSTEDASLNVRDPRRYVGAESINFFVFPGKLGLGAKLGDFGVVIRPEKSDYNYAVSADVGPANKIGETSIALAAALGIQSSPKNGGTTYGIVYVVFPGSQQGWPRSQAESDQYGSTLFAKWGGLSTARECYPDLPWSA